MAKGGQTSDLTIFIEKERFPLIFSPHFKYHKHTLFDFFFFLNNL